MIGGRRPSAQPSGSPSSTNQTPVGTPRQQPTPSVTPSPSSPSDGSQVSSASKPSLKGWATEHDLSSSRQPVIMSGSHVTRNVPLSSAKSSPSLNQDEPHNVATSNTPRGYSPKPLKTMTRSTTDLPEHVNYENVTSPTSPKSPGWYQQPLPNRSVFDFSPSSNSRRSPRNSYAGGSPRNSYASGSPRNSYAGLSSAYSSASPMPGFAPMSVPSTSLYQPVDQARSSAYSAYNQNPNLTGANVNSFDDTPTPKQNRSYDRRSLPPQALNQFREYEREYEREFNKTNAQKHLTSMPVTREEDDTDREVRGIRPKPPNDLDLRPMCSPPAPPVRDISSLKYVKSHQNHEKYPSWPVTAAQQPQNFKSPIDTQQSEKGKESESSSEKSDQSQRQYAKERTKKESPSVERKGSDEFKQPRNQSDPGFKKPKKSFYTTRKPVEPSNENTKPEGERFDEFYKSSNPGYPPPKLDPDGHNYGDEKYSIPSPPERDVPGCDDKSLVEKIAAMISPQSQPYHYSLQYNMEHGGSRGLHSDASPHQFHSANSKVPGMYFQQAMNAQNLLRSNNSRSKGTVDSCTSPIPNHSEEKSQDLKTITANPRHPSAFSPAEKPRAIVITQKPYYNTSTQTDDSLAADSGIHSTYGPSSISSMSSSVTVKSDSSSHSSGISSMTFSDQSSAGMLRKLSEEFYRGRLHGINPSDRRLSSASAYDHDLKSPRSDAHFGVLKEAESCNSVVIHAHESSGPFGRDDMGSSPSLASSKPEMSDNEHDSNDFRHRARYSMDSGSVIHKASASMSMVPRNLNESRFTSESNLSSGHLSQRNSHSQSLLQLNRPPSALSDPRQFSQSSYTSSSTSSRPRGSMEARSSGSRVSSASSNTGDLKPDKFRLDSDSVFYDGKVSPAPEGNDGQNSDSGKSGTLGRKESMKMAYGTYDEHEHQYATPYGHQRNNSEVLSPSARDAAHGRSMSLNDYLPMHANAAEALRLGQITEEGSEIRWQEAVQKSKSLSRGAMSSNYENINISSGNDGNSYVSVKESDSEKSDNEKKRSGMRRTASEQFKPKKDRQKEKLSDSSKGGYSSSGGESSKGNKSDGENVGKPLSHQHLSDSDLKKRQQEAVLDFVKRKKKGSDSSEQHSPNVKDTAPESPPPPIPDGTSPLTGTTNPPHSPLTDITKRYNYTQAQRNESMRRTQSITSNSSKESDYMDMKKMNIQTEWSRLRAQDSKQPRRPLSIGSDFGSVDGHSTPSILTPDGEPVHKRSTSETLPKHIEAAQAQQEPTSPESIPPAGDDGTMVTAPIYHNLSTGDYPRRPPPPVPGVHSESPPALPPRRFINSKSESFLLSRVDPSQQEALKSAYQEEAGVIAPSGTRAWEANTGTLKEDAYAAQLRRQARRFSEQHKPVGISMQVVSTKSTVQVSLSQSYKQEPAAAMEAKSALHLSPQTSHSQLDAKQICALHSPPLSRDRATPEPPPMPTPLKNGEVEVPVDLNATADFPPPPVEFMEGTDNVADLNGRCADDSYGSYKTRSPRELGKYKRTTSDTTLLRQQQDVNTFQPLPENNETPNKPPRKRLEGRDSPNLGQRSSNQYRRSPPQVPAFQSADVTSVPHVVKSVAQPLPKVNLPTSMTSSGSFTDTVVQRPGDRNSVSEEPRPTVKDRVKNIEVFAHSPGSTRSGSRERLHSNGSSGATGDEKKDSSMENHKADSLERLESSVTHSDSFRDRLRPVVKKVSDDESKHSEDMADIVSSTPPVVPNRTYKQQQPAVSNSSSYRKDSFQNHGPKPYANKSNNSANIHNPLHQNNVVNFSQSQDMKRSPGQSIPEPQVPARSWKNEQFVRDQNSSVSSPDSRHHGDANDTVKNKENTQVTSVQSRQKWNHETTFSPNTRSHIHKSDNQNVAIFQQNHHPKEKTRDSEQNPGTVPSHSMSSPPQSWQHPPTSDNRHPSSQTKMSNTSPHTQNISTSVNRSDRSTHSNRADQTLPDQPVQPALSQVSLNHGRQTVAPLVSVQHGRQPSAEELECDLRAQELAKVLGESERELCEVLQSDSKMSRMQFLDGILQVEPETPEERRPRSATKGDEKSTPQKSEEKSDEPTSPMPSNYYVSPPKAMIELEIRKLTDSHQLGHDIADNDTLAQKKEELLQRMMKKVEVLKEDKKELLSDITENETLGKQVGVFVETRCRSQQEKDKYRSYIDDIDKIIRLLLKLSGLLARAENTIQGLKENTNEKVKKMTLDKRDRLYQQHEDAKQLKVDIDRRREQVEAFLGECLSGAELQDYQYYIRMKSKYTIQLQELEDKITLGTEQISALQKSMPLKK
ncbi:hypothetical protein DPMN_073359 [Dreissena polymorpha]|uniref:ASD2 domain-containing protein n=1 Tax=Dreissena polymorpha TaxID=45954 RepID=A0A9D4BYW3_DREPO|nr:hypothetical protein DPMN_073359 [Dreissena polymorpha]